VNYLEVIFAVKNNKYVSNAMQKMMVWFRILSIMFKSDNKLLTNNVVTFVFLT
jgi:hypothetical protein